MRRSGAASYIAKAHRALTAAHLLEAEGELEGTCNRAYYARLDEDVERRSRHFPSDRPAIVAVAAQHDSDVGIAVRAVIATSAASEDDQTGRFERLDAIAEDERGALRSRVELTRHR